MLLLDWYRQWLEIRTEFRAKRAEVSQEEKICQSCETLKQQLEIANYEKQQLLNRIIEKPAPEPEKQPIEVTRPKMIPWNVRKQMLEREDREKAKLMKNAPKPDAEKADVAELEKELDIASAEREAQSAGAQ